VPAHQRLLLVVVSPLRRVPLRQPARRPGAARRLVRLRPLHAGRVLARAEHGLLRGRAPSSRATPTPAR
jgi:hypothetical protein